MGGISLIAELSLPTVLHGRSRAVVCLRPSNYGAGNFHESIPEKAIVRDEYLDLLVSGG